MAKMGRPGMSDEARARVWEMWGSGSGFSEISRDTGYASGSIYTVIQATGGYVPALKRRRATSLTLEDREEISRGIARGDSFRQIGRKLGRAASTISREVARNGGRRKYRAIDADDRMWRRARRPKPCLLERDSELADYVRERLEDDWSPEQITGVLQTQTPLGEGRVVSAETIYKTIFVPTREVLDNKLCKHLRSRRPTRRNVHNSTRGQWRSQIKDAVSIHDRPAEVETRQIPGHWEGDLVLGAKVSQVATLVERTTGLLKVVQLDGRDMDTVAAGITREINKIPEALRATLTWDRGMELAAHKTITRDTGIKIYFADPRSPWQRGTNENTNGLLRQYLPKGVSMRDLTQHDLDIIANRINNRPRKRLGWHTPADTFARVALTT